MRGEGADTLARRSARSVARVDPGNGACSVLDVVSSSDGEGLAARLSNKQIKLYACDQSGLREVSGLVGHTDRVTGMAIVEEGDGVGVCSCSLDGTVRFWDPRSRREVNRFGGAMVKMEGLTCLAVKNSIIAAGGNGIIHFWDMRTQQKLADFPETHEMEVTKVAFHPSGAPKFFSSSSDGHLCVFDFSNGLDEDDGFEGAQNLSPIEDFGFYGQGGLSIWCKLSSGLALWEWAKFLDIESDEGTGPMFNSMDVRPSMNEACAELKGQVDYVLGCHFNQQSGEFLTIGGTDGGAMVGFPTNPTPRQRDRIFAPPVLLLEGAHNDVVRSLTLFNSGFRDFGVSGGDDGRLAVWG
ncbi:hypothetical protein BSKO_08554 [Bryopsis sp. KO-2023]|nr:hypothetical protein BSKO_08554 [Bryopsis sp. KO-2023]